ncbi:MAG: hypothetical protein GF331_20240 [Chitinivibrionales bacterium]|nr:hypothetical protein [Chitinivibrionales bacterium]
MDVVCAWCGTPIKTSADSRQGKEKRSHGMCPDCRDFFTENKPGTLHEFINRLPVPVLVVNEHRVVETANRRASEVLGKPLPTMQGRLGGEVMECAYARLPGGCGKTVHCAGCTIKQAVLETFASGVGVQGLETYQDLIVDGETQRMRIVISTEPAGGVVHVKIDVMEPADQS